MICCKISFNIDSVNSTQIYFIIGDKLTKLSSKLKVSVFIFSVPKPIQCNSGADLLT